MTNPELINLDADEPIDLMEWVQANTRWIAIGAAIVVVGAGGWWLYSQSQVRKEANAAQALFLAKQSIQSGNAPLAQSDLSKLVNRYKGTAGGAEGAMLLAQVHYDQSKFPEGIAVLDQALPSAPQAMQPEILGLKAEGYLGLKNPVSAAQEYEKAAEATDRQLERATQRARAARAYMAAGDTAKARQIWSDLSTDPKSASVAAEAKVRLGELTARPAKTS